MLLLAVGGFGVPVASSAQENDRAALIARDTATGGAHWTTTTNGTRSASSVRGTALPPMATDG